MLQGAAGERCRNFFTLSAYDPGRSHRCIMDGSRRAHFDTLPHVSAGLNQHRCGWCGLLPLPEDRGPPHDPELCGACSALLKDIDWRALLTAPAVAN